MLSILKDYFQKSKSIWRGSVPHEVLDSVSGSVMISQSIVKITEVSSQFQYGNNAVAEIMVRQMDKQMDRHMPTLLIAPCLMVWGSKTVILMPAFNQQVDFGTMSLV